MSDTPRDNLFGSEHSSCDTVKRIAWNSYRVFVVGWFFALIALDMNDPDWWYWMVLHGTVWFVVMWTIGLPEKKYEIGRNRMGMFASGLLITSAWAAFREAIETDGCFDETTYGMSGCEAFFETVGAAMGCLFFVPLIVEQLKRS